MTRVPIIVAAACAGLMSAGPPAMADGTYGSGAAQPSSGSYAPACPDYGSYGVVDGPRRQARGIVSAQPYNTCADLPSQARQPQIYIGADVQIGNGTADTQPGQGQTPLPSPWQQPGNGRWPGGGGGNGGGGNGITWSPQARPVLQPQPMRRP